MILAYVGGFDPAYPRNAVLRAGLARLGVDVKTLFVSGGGVLGRGAEIVRRLSSLHPRPDVVLVAEFCHKDVPAAWLGARRIGALCASDPLISREDTMVGDWGIYSPRSIDGWACRRWDEIAFGWPRVVVADTAVHARRFADRVGRPPFPVVYVGAADEFFDVPDDEPAPSPLRVLYVGGFLPLHGVDSILEAAEHLKARPESPRILLELVGDGIVHDAMRARATASGLESHVVFHGRRPLDELAGRMASAHVVLGVFQKDGEGARVLPNKVVQGLAAGRCVVTSDTPAARELLVDDGNAVLVPAGDGTALAAALVRLAADPARRQRIAAAGRSLARTTLSAEATARQLLLALGARAEKSPAHAHAHAAAQHARARRGEPAITPPVPAAPAGA
jgi:glycosyltransferase involved in cell wall biosynthesis